MKIIALDDKPLQRRALASAIREAAPDAEVITCASAEEVLAIDNLDDYDVAFIDIDMPGMSGVDLARKLRAAHPELNVVFATAFGEYMPDAFELHSSGYLMKPITAAKVRAELEDLRRPPEPAVDGDLVVKCFGDFEVFASGVPVAFKRRQTKELFAYLVDRRGAMCSMADVAAIFWGDKSGTKSHRSYLRTLVADMRATLEELGLSDVIVKRHGEIGVRTDSFECDYYSYLNGNLEAIAAWQGEYMRQYSWAESTAASLILR
jgi:two-component SAPR family response regulator